LTIGAACWCIDLIRQPIGAPPESKANQ